MGGSTMIFQDVIFLCDKDEYLSNSNFWKQMRLSLYDLRNFAFNHETSVRVNFSVISETSNADFDFHDFDTFSISKEKQEGLFSKHSWNDLKTFIKNGKSSELDYSLKIIYLKSSDTSPELFEDTELYSILKLQRVRMTTVRSAAINDYSASIHKIVNKKTTNIGKIFSKKAVGFLCAGIFIAAVISCIPIFVRQHESNSIKYEKVYTGDGDRLIMRKEPSKDAREIIRLYENEVVQIVNRGDEWDEVNYHGLRGFCHNEYFVTAEKNGYIITNPEAKFLYGMSCLKYIDSSDIDGIKWIQEAAEEGVIKASRELVDYYNGSDYLNELLRIDQSTNSIEDRNIILWKEQADGYKKQDNKELYKKFTNKSKELETEVKTIRQWTADHLSKYYYGNNNNLASSYYQRAIELGLKPSNDYMYNLARCADLSYEESVRWLAKASDDGHGKSSYELGEKKIDDGAYREAIKYYGRAYDYGYNKEKSAYNVALIYWNIFSEYSSAFSWFLKVIDINNTYSREYCDACYALGQCYENGWGCYQDVYGAMNYYEKASTGANARSGAKEAYDRLYNQYGGYYSWW